MKQGDIVAYAPPRKGAIYAKIVRWSGDPDARVLLMDAHGNTYRPYADSTVRLESDVARAFRLEIDAFLLTKSGRQALKDAAAPVTARIDARGKRTTVKTAIQPDPSPGSPDPSQEPLKLVDGFSGNPNKRFLKYLSGRQTEYGRMMHALRGYNPRHAEVLFRNVEGERLTSIAKRLGIKATSARWHKHQAITFAIAWFAEQADALDAKTLVQPTFLACDHKVRVDAPEAAEVLS